MAKIRNISILVYEKFEQERIANGLTADAFLGNLLGVPLIPKTVPKPIKPFNTPTPIKEAPNKTE